MEDESGKIVPEELVNLWIEYQALIELRDSYVRQGFGGFKRAKKTAIEATTKRDIFWRKVSELYPELKRPLRFQWESRRVYGEGV